MTVGEHITIPSISIQSQEIEQVYPKGHTMLASMEFKVTGGPSKYEQGPKNHFISGLKTKGTWIGSCHSIDHKRRRDASWATV